MALTVFAEKMGFFHKGSAGFGVAPLDVCLSPPPGPVPIPYTNVLFAKDLIKGSKTVRIDGEPTFLEDYSETSTSIGDEGGTLGGSVITGVILGKGYFMVWSMTVHIEGLGVCRHGDMMGQNSASSPPSSIDAAAVSKPANVSAPVPAPVAAQRAAQAKVLQATGPGDSKPAVQVPCDFEKIEIECSHTGAGKGKRGFGPFEYTYNGQIRDNLPRPKDRRRVFVPNIQAIAGTRDSEAETLKIKLSGGPGYGCSKKHPRISITNRATGQKQTHEGKTEVEFKAKCVALPPPMHSSMSPAAIIGYFWFPPGATTSYTVEVESCGVLANLGKGFRKLSRQIDVFSSDEYKLSIEIPSAVNRNYEKAGTGPRKFPLLEHIPPAKPVAPGHSRWNRETTYNKGPKPIDQAIVEIASSVKLERNNGDLKVTESLGKLVRAIAEIENNIQSVMNFIKDLQPTVGWKFSFSIGFFKGGMELEWAAKEAPDHTVYRWWKFTPSLTLISLDLDVEFGVDVAVLRTFKITVVLFGQVGGEVKLDTPVEATPTTPSWETTIGLDIKGELGIKAALGADWVTATGKMVVAFPFEAKPKIDPGDGFGIHWKVDFKGLNASLIGSIKFVGNFSTKVQWIPPRNLGQGRFPEGGTKPTSVPAPGGR